MTSSPWLQVGASGACRAVKVRRRRAPALLAGTCIAVGALASGCLPTGTGESRFELHATNSCDQPVLLNANSAPRNQYPDLKNHRLVEPGSTRVVGGGYIKDTPSVVYMWVSAADATEVGPMFEVTLNASDFTAREGQSGLYGVSIEGDMCPNDGSGAS